MMNNFLLEIYGEELPSSAQRLVESELVKLFSNLFSKYKVKYSKIFSYSSSRRVAFIVNNLEKETKEDIEEIRGPATNAQQLAINGFLKKNNIKFSNLKKKTIKNKEYFFFINKTEPLKVEKILEKNIPTILRSVNWKKSMRWNIYSDKWIRPIKNIVCVFEGKKILFDFAGITSEDFTFGNYNYGEDIIKIDNIAIYEKILKDKNVIISRDERQKAINKEINNFCKKNKLTLVENKNLFERVSDSVEFPNVFFAKFQDKYFTLPEFLIKSVMFDKQDYFCFMDKEKLSNSFAFISNHKKIKKERLVKGNENVLKARFSDAIFFIEEDTKIKLENRLNKLKDIIFISGAGNLFQRAERIKFITEKISIILNFKSGELNKYIILSNADLTCELVKEFPSLQGKVGGFYASIEKLPKQISHAFFNQYNLEFNDTSNNTLSYILSVSQKLDAVVGYFISYKKLSGAGDPFGVRRSVLSIIKLCIDKKINLDFVELIDFNLQKFDSQNIKFKLDKNIIIDFFNKRMRVLFNEYGYDYSLIDSVISNKKVNPVENIANIKSIYNFSRTDNGIDFFKAYKRLSSIKEEMGNKNVNSVLFEFDEERLLNDNIISLEKIDNTITFIKSTKLVKTTTKNLNNFFDNVKVNVENKESRENRKQLINKIYRVISRLINLQ